MANPNLGCLRSTRQSRERSLARYYLNPKLCDYCKNPIQIRGNRRASSLRKNKFCGLSCSAKANNKLPRKRGGSTGRRVTRVCLTCSDPIEMMASSRTKYCSKSCKARSILRRDLSSVTKGLLFSVCASWQAARSTIQKDARTKFLANAGSNKCSVCGYSNHVQVCHRKSVSSFKDSATIGEINNFGNLIGLCPNHHWEFDHGILVI